MRYGMVIDLKRCIGCYGCQIFCKMENATPPGMMWSRVLLNESGKYPTVRKTPLPLLCMHCKEPVCVEVCPTGASVKREDGIVVIDHAKCLGCGSCVVACPYRARSTYDKEREYFPGQGLTPYEKVGYQKHTTGTAEKCDFCLSRLEREMEPACVANCMAHARFFGDLDDLESEVSRLIRTRGGFQLYPELGTDPSVYYLAP
ncbi:MAG: 4Fe-4S dicluster domain-containing protein [Chloroflexota bacterium]